MGFTFLHTADWQIGKPFRMFPPKLAGRLEEARLTVIDRLALEARGRGAKHVLVAGDVYDSPSLPDKTRRQPMAKMQRYNDITWVLLPGNHDPARAGGIWQRVMADGLPANVRVVLTPDVFELEKGVMVLPAPLTAKALSEDPTAWMDGAETPAGFVRIGLAHGSVRGFGSQDDSSVLIDPGRAASARLSYLALGDWHGMAEINKRTWYSGTPEPERFRDNNPGNALVVTVYGADGDPVVEPIASAYYTWASFEELIMSGADRDGIDQKIKALSEDSGRVLLKLSVEGVVDADVFMEIERWRDAWDARLQYLEADFSQLRANVNAADVPAIRDSTELRETVQYLEQIAGGDDVARAGVATAALRRLLVIAGAVAGDASA